MECGISQCITPQQHPGGLFSLPGSQQHPGVPFSLPGSSGSHSSGSGIARHGCPTLAAKVSRVILAPGDGDPPSVAAINGGGGAIVAADGDALAADQVAPPDEPEGALTCRDYPLEPPKDSSIFSDWLLNVPLPFGPNDPPLTISLIHRVDYRLSHSSD